MTNRLNIVQMENMDKNNKIRWEKKRSKREETQARFERLWLIDPEQFDPKRNCIEEERLFRSLNLLKEFVAIDQKEVVDLGCGWGDFSAQIKQLGGNVVAVDIAANAFKHLKKRHPEIEQTKQDYIPKTTLDDEKFDVVAALDLIAFLSPDDHRIFFAELSRLVKPDGYLLCSTPVDFHTEDPVQLFADLAETEFQIEKWSLSYHRCFIHLLDFIEAPRRFAKAAKDVEYRQKEIGQRKGFMHTWFRLNSSSRVAWFWKGIAWLTHPIAEKTRYSRRLMLFCEKFTKTFWDTSGISHVIFIGKRRALIIPEAKPREPKHKKEVWE